MGLFSKIASIFSSADPTPVEDRTSTALPTEPPSILHPTPDVLLTNEVNKITAFYQHLKRQHDNLAQEVESGRKLLPRVDGQTGLELRHQIDYNELVILPRFRILLDLFTADGRLKQEVLKQEENEDDVVS